MKWFTSLFFILLVGLLSKCLQKNEVDKQAIKKEIFLTLDKQVKSWNQCDMEGYMAGYWQSDSLRFASGNAVTYGWQKTLDGYKRRYNTPEAIGHLDFSYVKITVFSEDAALAFGRYTLTRKNDTSSGLFTVIFRKKEEGWRIVADHTSGD